jgi:hypothetical protein
MLMYMSVGLSGTFSLLAHYMNCEWSQVVWSVLSLWVWLCVCVLPFLVILQTYPQDGDRASLHYIDI